MNWSSFALILLLVGCSAAPLLPSRPLPADISAYAFSGRLAVRQGSMHHHVRVDWRHDPGSDTILLATPLGQGIAELSRDAGGARLVLADRRRFEAPNWDALTEQVFGFRLPLSSSARWLLGETTDSQGWRLAITERESAAAHALPTAIEFERDDISVHLKIDEWSEVQ